MDPDSQVGSSVAAEIRDLAGSGHLDEAVRLAYSAVDRFMGDSLAGEMIANHAQECAKVWESRFGVLPEDFPFSRRRLFESKLLVLDAWTARDVEILLEDGTDWLQRMMAQSEVRVVLSALAARGRTRKVRNAATLRLGELVVADGCERSAWPP